MEEYKLIEDFTGSPFNNDWNGIMDAWLKIMSLESVGRFQVERAEVNKSTITLSVYLLNRKWRHNTFYHSCRSSKMDCENMFEVYYKTIIEFINWYNENRKS